MSSVPKYLYRITISDTIVETVSADRHEEDEENQVLVLYRGDDETGRYRLDRIIGYNYRPTPLAPHPAPRRAPL